MKLFWFIFPLFGQVSNQLQKKDVPQVDKPTTCFSTIPIPPFRANLLLINAQIKNLELCNFFKKPVVLLAGSQAASTTRLSQEEHS